MKWIKLKDKQPEKDQECIVWVSDDQNQCDIAAWDGERFDCNSTPNNYREVTHWMEAPKEP